MPWYDSARKGVTHMEHTKLLLLVSGVIICLLGLWTGLLLVGGLGIALLACYGFLLIWQQMLVSAELR